jgi:hypothetical protein
VSISLCGSSVRGFLSEVPKGYMAEGSGDGHHPMRVYSAGTLRDSFKRALETGHLSLWELF